MTRLITCVLLLASLAWPQVADDYQIIITSNTVSSDGLLTWRCDKNGVTVVALNTSQFDIATSNTDVDAFLKDQLAKCRADNAGTLTEERQSHSKPVRHGSNEHDSSVATLSGGVLASSEFAAANKSFVKDIVLMSPATTDTSLIQVKFAQNVTISRVSCSTDTGTVTIQLDERIETTPNTAGTDVMTSTLVCDNNNEATTSFSNATIALDAPLNLQITAASGSPGVVRLHIDVSID